MSILAGFWWGFVGGAAGYLFGSRKIHSLKKPEAIGEIWKKEVLIVILISGLLGGIVCVAYISSETELTPLLCINIGVSAPFVIGSANKTPIDPGNTKR